MDPSAVAVAAGRFSVPVVPALPNAISKFSFAVIVVVTVFTSGAVEIVNHA